MPSGKKITMEVEPGDTIHELKEFLFSENATDIIPDAQLIQFKEHKCSDHSSFQSLGIIDNSVLTLSVKQEYVEVSKENETNNNSNASTSAELKLIQTILKNILDHPQNPKYKDLNFTKIKQRLNNSSTYLRWLRDAGFEKSNDNQRFILNPSNMVKVKQVYSSLLVVMRSENANNHHMHYDIINELNKPMHHSSRKFDSEHLLTSSFTSSQTCKLDKCSSVTQIGNILKRYELLIQKKQRDESKQTDTNTMNNLYGNENENDITLLNDYNHLLVKHSNDFEDIYNTLCAVVYNGTCCTLSKCLLFRRNKRDRNKTSNDTLKELYFDIDNNNIVTQQLIDKIHCYFFHSFDSGYKLTHNEKQNILNSDHEEKINVEPGPDFDENIAKMHHIIKSKNKSISSKHNVSNKYKLDNFKASSYDFGQRYFYWDYYKDKDVKRDPAAGYGGYTNVLSSLKDGYVQKKYKNLKSELILNKIHTITKSEWLQLKLKANKYLESDIVRNMFCPRQKSAIYYEMTYGQKMDDNHLISVMVYCNNDTLQSKFTATYRRMNENESNEQLKQRHSNYHFLARFLREVIECFGMKIPNISYTFQRLYHGVNRHFVFESMFAAVSGPFSTTTDYTVAVSFSGNKGMILALTMNFQGWIMRMDEGEAAQQRICCFDCKWISDFSNESEIFCIGGQSSFVIENIIDVSISFNAKFYIKGIQLMTNSKTVRMFSSMTGSTKEYYPAIDQNEVQMMYRLLCHRLFSINSKHEFAVEFKSCPVFIKTLLDFHCNSIKRIEFRCDKTAIRELLQFEAMQYKTLDMVYKTDNEWLNLNLISSMFPNINRIEYNTVNRDVPFVCKGLFFEKIYSFITNIKSSIRQITIRVRSLYKEEMMRKLEQYQHRFTAQNWKMKIESISDVMNRQGMDISIIRKMMKVDNQRLTDLAIQFFK